MTGAEEGSTRALLTVRAGEGGFRLVTHSAPEAVALSAPMRGRGLSDVHVLDGDGQRLEPETLEAMATSETSDPVSANGQG